MPYTSLEFAVFLAAVVVGYHGCPLRWRRGYLLVASYAYYCAWSIRFGVLLLAVSWVAYWIGGRIATSPDPNRRYAYVWTGVVLLLMPLLAFKYVGGLEAMTGWLAGSTVGAALVAQFAGAVGISYYTLKLISYVVDVYWERQAPCGSFASVATYAAFFPQILSGPIQRAGDFLDQIESPARPRPAVVISGMQLILFGLFKKLVLADRLGVLVDQVFAEPRAFSGGVVALAAYLFAIQLYADFSGLTDIAIGMARLFGIQSPPNFDSPFYAENMQEFWRRWHMTLTTWLRDYLFTPLRMALRDRGQLGLIVSLAVNMVAIGVWHGPRLTFVAFGVLHAVYLIGSSLSLRARTKWLRARPALSRLHALVGPLVTFNMVVVSFVFFRADSVADAWQVFRRAGSVLTGARGTGFGALAWGPADVAVAVFALIVMEAIHLLRHRRQLSGLIHRMPAWARWTAYCALGFTILLWGESGSTQFIYVRF
ncbi:MAG TPA: MBOAT family O-acyltransferase [Candidatus Dormibacteraeota bacterium]|nr:MBOAT family O-acyltransferase [Candidatus Dormibacteraeota bacterium]